jgi:ABC-type Fe3+/spermidine/putrescine transport system ATPase subunit
MVDGRILQIGTVTELVATPTDAFVATFTGATLLPGCVVGSAEGVTEILLDSGATAWSADPGSGRVNVVVYPWEVSLARQPPNGSALNHIRGPVASIVPLGDRVRVRVGPVVAEITAASARRLKLREGDTLVASFKATSTRLLGVP